MKNAVIKDEDERELKSRTSIDDVEIEAEVTELQKIEEILSAADVSGGYVMLQRKEPNSTKWSHLAKIAIADFDLENVKAVYGGGEYKGQSCRANGGFFRKFEFNIDSRLKGSLDTPMAQSSNGLDAKTALLHADESHKQLAELQRKAAGDSQGMMMSFMAMMQESSKYQMLMMQESSKQQMASMQAMMQSIATMSQGNKSGSDIAVFVPILIEMIKSKSSGGSTMTEAIEAVRQLKDLSADDADKEKPEEDMFDKMLKLLGPVAVGFINRGQPQPQVQEIQTQVNAGQPTNVVQMDQNDPRHQAMNALASIKSKLKMVMPFLIKAAANDTDPQSYYDFVYDSLSDDEFTLLVTALKEENWADILFDGDPVIHRLRSWFEKLRLVFIEELEIDETSQAVPVTQSALE